MASAKKPIAAAMKMKSVMFGSQYGRSGSALVDNLLLVGSRSHKDRPVADQETVKARLPKVVRFELRGTTSLDRSRASALPPPHFDALTISGGESYAEYNNPLWSCNIVQSDPQRL
jgi:hypothetical protein